MGGAGGFDPFGANGFGKEEAFNDFWEGIDDFFGNFGDKKQARQQKKGKDVTVNLELDFMEAVEGCKKEVSFHRTSICSVCNGSKCKPGTSPTKCSTCGGSGRIYIRQGMMSIAMECNSCNGEGTMIRNPCMTCYGKGYTSQTTTEAVNVPKGVGDNMNLRVAKKGNFSPGGANGDLYVKIKINPHPYFQRDNFDIYTTNYVTIAQAVLGGQTQIQTLYGQVTVDVSKGTNDGDTKKLSNYVVM